MLWNYLADLLSGNGYISTDTLKEILKELDNKLVSCHMYVMIALKMCTTHQLVINSSQQITFIDLMPTGMNIDP
jgi:Ca2+-binding EF-hand superfamily protein